MSGAKRLSTAITSGLFKRSSGTNATPDGVVKGLDDEVVKLKAEIEVAQASIKSATEEIERVKDVVVEAEGKVKKAEQEVEALEEELAEARKNGDTQAADRKEARIVSKEQTISDLRRSIDTKEQLILSKEQTIDTKEQTINTKEQTINDRENKKSELLGLMTLKSVWDALATKLPYPTHAQAFASTTVSKYGSSDTSKHNYHPKAVLELTPADLVKVLEPYRAAATSDTEARIKDVRGDVAVLLGSDAFHHALESDVSDSSKRVFEVVTRVFNNDASVPSLHVKPAYPMVSCGRVTLATSGWNGQPDLTVNLDSTPPKKTTKTRKYMGVLCVEIKTPKYETPGGASLAGNWCNDVNCGGECGKENHPKPVSSSNSNPTGQQNKWKSPIRQVYSYMCANQKRVAVLSTYDQWWLVARDCSQQVFVSRAFTPSSQGDSLLQTLFLWLQLAMDADEQQSQQLAHITGWVPCPPVSSSSSMPFLSSNNSKCKHNVTKRVFLPKNVQGGPKGTERMVVSVGCFEKVEDLGTWKTGAAWVTDFDGQRGVVKCADCSKNPEAEEHVLRETKIYEHLKQLQGDAIPRLLYGDYTMEDFLYALCTSYGGKSLSEFKGHVSQELADNVRECIKKVNGAGVWHKDIAARNFVVDDNLNVKLIDFGEADLALLPTHPADESQQVEQVLAELREQ